MIGRNKQRDCSSGEAVAPRTAAVWLFVLFLAIYLMNASGHLYAIDEQASVFTAKALALRGSFAVLPENEQAVLNVGMRNAHGKVYSKYPPLVAIAMVPAARLGLALKGLSPAGAPGGSGDFSVAFLCSFVNSFFSAAAVMLLFLYCRAMGLPLRVSVAAAFLSGLCTIVFPYAKMSFPEPLAGLLLLCCMYFLALYRSGGENRYLAAAAAAAALMPLARLSMVFLGPAIVVYAMFRRPALKGAAAIAFGLGTGVFIHALYNFARFGSFFETGYGGDLTKFSPSLLIGIYGMLISSDKSIFVYSPVLLLMIPGVFAARKRGRGLEAAVIVLMLMACVLFYSRYEYWMGGHCWGARYIVSLIPVCMAVAAFALYEFKRPVWRNSIILLAVLGFAVQFCAVSAKFIPHYENGGVAADIAVAFKQGRLLRPGTPRFIPLRLQAADTVENYVYTISHAGGYFSVKPEDFKGLSENRLLERAPDFWLPLVWLSSGWKVRVLCAAAGMVLFFLGVFSGVSLAKEIRKWPEE